MNYILFLGDSFCACDKDEKNHWPRILSDLLNKNIQGRCCGGGSIASTLHLLHSYSSYKFENTDIVVFCHTQRTRPPSHELWRKYYKDDIITKKEFDDISSVYYKDILDELFLDFFESRWFEWIGKHFEGKKIVHLHSFDESLSKINLLKGINVTPSLSSISLKEADIQLHLDYRQNHLSGENNRELACQLSEIISNNNEGTFQLDLSKFKLK